VSIVAALVWRLDAHPPIEVRGTDFGPTNRRFFGRDRNRGAESSNPAVSPPNYVIEANKKPGRQDLNLRPLAPQANLLPVRNGVKTLSNKPFITIGSHCKELQRLAAFLGELP
jgi:hypothetical protein